MAYTAQHRFARIAPRKVRPVVDLIRGQPAARALEILRSEHRRGSFFVNKVLRSAISNAESDRDVDTERLVVREARVDGGPIIRRWRPRSRGAAFMICKRTSHITIGLDMPPAEAKPAAKKEKKKAKKSA